MVLLKVWSKVNSVYNFSEKNYPLCWLQYKSEHLLSKENFDNKYVTTEEFNLFPTSVALTKRLFNSLSFFYDYQIWHS